jgi:hypothetical protein
MRESPLGSQTPCVIKLLARSTKKSGKC